MQALALGELCVPVFPCMPAPVRRPTLSKQAILGSRRPVGTWTSRPRGSVERLAYASTVTKERTTALANHVHPGKEPQCTEGEETNRPPRAMPAIAAQAHLPDTVYTAVWREVSMEPSVEREEHRGVQRGVKWGHRRRHTRQDPAGVAAQDSH